MTTTLPDLFGARTAVVVPDVVAPALAAEVRARLEPQYVRYALVDRAHFEHVPALDEPALRVLAARVAEAQTGRALEVVEARALRLRPGDYVLARHDRLHEGLPLEVTLDLSPAVVPDADLHYRRRGDVFFAVPSRPGIAAVVERGPTVTCNHVYVSQRLAPGSVVRAMFLLRDRGWRASGA